jgi:hypothetical protein
MPPNFQQTFAPKTVYSDRASLHFGDFMYLEYTRFKKSKSLLDWAGSEGTAGWFAIFTHFRKL